MSAKARKIVGHGMAVLVPSFHGLPHLFFVLQYIIVTSMTQTIVLCFRVLNTLHIRYRTYVSVTFWGGILERKYYLFGLDRKAEISGFVRARLFIVDPSLN